jgi:hypothetical protein
LLIVFVSIPTLAYLHRAAETYYDLDQSSMYDAARLLSNYNHNYTMAVSEAGLLPLYSGWKAIDTWGLNDQWIAHHGEITESYLDRYKPEVIVLHDEDSSIEGWNSMISTVKNYAEKNRYIVAATYGDDPQDVHHYYVRRGLPDGTDIAKRICNMDYSHPSPPLGEATNYATDKVCNDK